jgi:hypothetical protein
MLADRSRTRSTSEPDFFGTNDAWPQPGLDDAQAPVAESQISPAPHSASEVQYPLPFGGLLDELL